VGANILGFNGYVLSEVGDVPIDNELFVVTPSIFDPVFKGAHRGRVCMRAFIGVSVRALQAFACIISKKPLSYLC
jgi:hypothetical protein